MEMFTVWTKNLFSRFLLNNINRSFSKAYSMNDPEILRIVIYIDVKSHDIPILLLLCLSFNIRF